MSRIRDIDYKILFELMKNSKISDRKLSKKIGVSQPTITRRRTRLEKNIIDTYTVIPSWEGIGYEIFAITLVKVKPEVATKNKSKIARKRGLEFLMSQPNIIMGGGCRGMGMSVFHISLHKNYSDYDDWMLRLRSEMGDLIEDAQSILVNLRGKELLKPLNLKYLAGTK
ncbi:MAG: Lrp/AsnC family transcriptional regulator [Candidatus Bathyarchaeota archaeon]|nr:MAG: Lrp/AsnC family transcriptional regulator [Candidatus Bathyarchaeota archaeon]